MISLLIKEPLLRKGIQAKKYIIARSSLPTLETAKGDQITVCAEAIVTIQLGSCEFETIVVVADLVDDFILGLERVK